MFTDANIQTVVALNAALLLQLAGIAFAVALDPYIKRDDRNRVYAIVVLV